MLTVPSKQIPTFCDPLHRRAGLDSSCIARDRVFKTCVHLADNWIGLEHSGAELCFKFAKDIQMRQDSVGVAVNAKVAVNTVERVPRIFVAGDGEKAHGIVEPQG